MVSGSIELCFGSKLNKKMNSTWIMLYDLDFQNTSNLKAVYILC